jgi:hypothetical protein
VNKVRFLPVAAILLASLPVLARAGDDDPGSMPQETSARIKEAFPYDPTAKRNREEKKDADDDVVAMEPFAVVTTLLPRAIRERIDRGSVSTDNQFSLSRGGSISGRDLGKVRMDIGPTFSRSGWSFLRFSW